MGLTEFPTSQTLRMFFHTLYFSLDLIGLRSSFPARLLQKGKALEGWCVPSCDSRQVRPLHCRWAGCGQLEPPAIRVPVMVSHGFSSSWRHFRDPESANQILLSQSGSWPLTSKKACTLF